MTLAIAIEKRLEREIGPALEIMGHVHDRPEGLDEADTKAAFIDPILSALGWELRDPVTGHRNRSTNCRRALVKLDSRSYWRVRADSHWRRVVVALTSKWAGTASSALETSGAAVGEGAGRAGA